MFSSSQKSLYSSLLNVFTDKFEQLILVSPNSRNSECRNPAPAKQCSKGVSGRDIWKQRSGKTLDRQICCQRPARYIHIFLWILQNLHQIFLSHCGNYKWKQPAHCMFSLIDQLEVLIFSNLHWYLSDLETDTEEFKFRFFQISFSSEFLFVNKQYFDFLV